MKGHLFITLVLLTGSWTLSVADSNVTCILGEDCALPCHFQKQDNVIVKWLKNGQPFHSYYYHIHDATSTAGRHSIDRSYLYPGLIQRGVASLQLREVKPEDQGEYLCYVTGLRNQYQTRVNVKVQAKNNEATTELDNRLVDGLVGIRSAESPAATTEQVSPTGGVAAVDNFTLSTPGPTATAPKGGAASTNKVHVEEVADTIVCSSERIYPKPTVTWSTEPPSNKTLQSKTTVEQTSPLLYSFTSTLKILPEDAGKIYICAVVSSEYGMNATMRVEGGRGQLPVFGLSYVLVTSGIGFLTVLVVIAILSFRGKTRRYDTTTVPLRLLAF